jgi:hypothetical protein
LASTDETELIYIDGHTFDLDDLTYAERRETKRIARTEIWDEGVDGPFEDLSSDDVMPAVILVLMRRHDPLYTLAQAMAQKPERIFEKPAPPTKRRAPKSSEAETASVTSGSPA